MRAKSIFINIIYTFVFQILTRDLLTFCESTNLKKHFIKTTKTGLQS